ncbi:hypothetical protein M514_14022, partial [Trichuris suis]
MHYTYGVEAVGNTNSFVTSKQHHVRPMHSVSIPCMRLHRVSVVHLWLTDALCPAGKEAVPQGSHVTWRQYCLYATAQHAHSTCTLGSTTIAGTLLMGKVYYVNAVDSINCLHVDLLESLHYAWDAEGLESRRFRKWNERRPLGWRAG